MKFHSLASVFPLMNGEEFENLKNDIKQYGQQNPIYTYNGFIIDGRNRYNACKQLNIEPKFKEWSGKGSLVSFIVSLNLHRRHLTAGQKAAIALEVLPELEREAKKRMVVNLKQGEKKPDRETIPYRKEESGKSTEHAAKLFGVNPRYISDAKKIKEEDPDTYKLLKKGNIQMQDAKKIVFKSPVYGKIPKLPKSKHRVIYIWPPLEDAVNGSGYPSFKLSELCALDIASISAENSVLFLWSTDTEVMTAVKIIASWGFDYKTGIVWNKSKKYNTLSENHYDILHIGTKGDCEPDSNKKIEFVQKCKESAKAVEKPEHFRKIIDSLYTNGRKIELFCRSFAPDDWTTWGPETE